jgi:hypothetical protein
MDGQAKFSVWNTQFAARHRQYQTKHSASFSDERVLTSREVVVTQNIINPSYHRSN